MNLPEPDFHNGALVALAQLLLMSLEVAGNRLGEAQNVDPELLEQMNETYAACLEHLSEHRYVPAFFTVSSVLRTAASPVPLPFATPQSSR